MAEHGALATLKDLAEKEVEDAARLLGEMRRGCQQAEEQLKMLIDYQNEYRNNLNSDKNCLVQNETGCHLSEAGDAVPHQAPCRKPNDLQDRTGAKFPLLPSRCVK